MANLNNAYLIDKRKAKNEESTEALVPEYWGWRRMFHNCVLHIPHSLFPLSELPMSVSSFPRHFFPSSRLEFLQINTIKQTCSLSLLLHMMPPVLFFPNFEAPPCLPVLQFHQTPQTAKGSAHWCWLHCICLLTELRSPCSLFFPTVRYQEMVPTSINSSANTAQNLLPYGSVESIFGRMM